MTHDHGLIQSQRSVSTAGATSQPGDHEEPGTGHSMWWMVACCAPMVLLVLAIFLGVFGSR